MREINKIMRERKDEKGNFMEKTFEICSFDSKENIISNFGNNGGLICIKTQNGKSNIMTVSWVGFCRLWGFDVFMLFVRKSRYSHEFMLKNEDISLNYLGENAKDILSFCGKYSGKIVDKIKEKNLHLFYCDGVPCIFESEYCFTGRKIYQGEFLSENFKNSGEVLLEKYYSEKDFHSVFVYRIEKCLKKRNILSL